jgi:hypothetical protein
VQVFKKPDPKELVRKWQADLRTEQRKIDRQIRGEQPNTDTHSRTCTRASLAHCIHTGSICSNGSGLQQQAYLCEPSIAANMMHVLCAADIQFETKKVEKTIKDAAKRNDLATCKVRACT